MERTDLCCGMIKSLKVMLSAKAVKTTPVTKGAGWNVKNKNIEGSEYQK